MLSVVTRRVLATLGSGTVCPGGERAAVPVTVLSGVRIARPVVARRVVLDDAVRRAVG